MNVGVVRMAQWVKFLLCKHDDLSLDAVYLYES